MGDDFLSVEHFVLAFHSDKRFGQQLFKNLQLSEKDLKDAVQAVRGNQRVTDQSKNFNRTSFVKYSCMLSVCSFFSVDYIFFFCFEQRS